MEVLLNNSSMCNNTSHETSADNDSVFIQLVDSDGSDTGAPVWVPLSMDISKMTNLLKESLNKSDDYDSTYDFFVGNIQILDDLKTALLQSRAKGVDTVAPVSDQSNLELVVKVVYQAQALFRVKPVTRCSSTLSGHTGAILVTQFSPNGKNLASGSGDRTVRFWDLDTQLPSITGSDAHQASVLCLSWSPDSFCLASGCQAGFLCIWKQSDVNGSWILSDKPLLAPQFTTTPLTSKNRWIRSIAWQPLHLNPDCRKIAVAYQNCSIIIWDIVLRQSTLSITGHDKPVVSVKWGGTDLIYTASQDRTIRVWRAKDGVLCRTLNLHGHWVNCLALSTDYVLRTGPFDPAHLHITNFISCSKDPETRIKMVETAKSLYEKVKGSHPERLASGSDDNTLSLWQPEVDKKPIAPRMVGHQGVVNDVKFSPDSRLLASVSFDHSVKIWDGFTGQFLATMFGHVQEVYLASWASDSRLLVSCSKDSTLKLWSVADCRRWNQESAMLSEKEKKKQIFASDVAGKKRSSSTFHQRKRHLLHDLPGHADAIYALDWSPDGQYVASGGKDRVLKLWRS